MTARRRRPDDLAGRWLTRFFIDHLAGERAASPRTIASYRDAIKLLLIWFKTEERIPPQKLRLTDIDRPRVTGVILRPYGGTAGQPQKLGRHSRAWCAVSVTRRG